MIRVWLLVLMTLSLWPSPAAAEAHAHAGQHPGQIGAPSVDYAREVLRSASGLEVVRRLDGQSGGGSTRLPPPEHLLSGYELVSLRVRLLARAEPGSAQDPVAPLCERLPYYATAPPASR